MKIEKTGKIGSSLFQKVQWDSLSAESIPLVFICAVFFLVSFFAGSRAMSGYDERVARMLMAEKVLAAEELTEETVGETFFGEDALPEAMATAADSVASASNRVMRARIAAKKHAVFVASVRGARTISGDTKKLSDGRRVCIGNSDRPQRGGKTHMDEDCCADYNETPNPRCYYPPEKLKIMKSK